MILPLWNVQDHVGCRARRRRARSAAWSPRPPSCSCRAATRSRCRARAPLLRARDRSPSTRPARDGAGRGRRALPGDPRPAARLDRPRPSGDGATSPCSGPGRRSIHGAARTSSSTAPSGRSTRSAARLPGGMPETRVEVDEETARSAADDGSVVEARYVLTDGTIAIDGDPVARDEALGVTLYGVELAAGLDDARHRPLQRPLVGPGGHLPPRALPRRHAAVTLGERPELVLRAADRARTSRRRRRADASSARSGRTRR